MQYTKLTYQIKGEEYLSDLLSAALAEYGCDSFETPTADTLIAYIPTSEYKAADLAEYLTNCQYLSAEAYSFVAAEECENKDWNQEWEKNFFKPIIIADKCVIHSTFHTDIPKCQYDIIIDPKMAFGTGHHQTTSLILSTLLNLNLKDKDVLDMGCGTGVLGILAHKLGAKTITGIDIDDWCVDNAKENFQLNNIGDATIMLCNAESLDSLHFDLILANINRNILLQDMDKYANSLNSHGTLIMSGFYTEDIEVLEAKAKTLNLRLQTTANKDNWAMMLLEKTI